MNFVSKLLSGKKAFSKGVLLLVVSTAAILATSAHAQIANQVIWDKYEGANTFWGSANQYSSSHPNAALSQDITWGLIGSDEVRAASISSVLTGQYKGFLQVNIYTAFLNRQNGANSDWPMLGDLFLSTTGWDPYVPNHPSSNQLNHDTADNSSNGTRWNVAFDSPDIGYKDALYAHSTFSAVEKGAVHRDAAGNLMNYDFDTGGAGRLNQEISWDSGGVTVGDYVFQARHATTQEKSAYDLYSGLTDRDWSVYTYIFDPNMLGLKAGQEIGLRWQPTCANDILEGGFIYNPPEGDLPPTPEPSTYGLLGAALCLGFAGFSRWRKQRKAA